MKYSYNTQQGDVILKEYGRNIQKIVQYIVSLEDKTERTRQAHNLIELMRQINPTTRDSQDYQNKLWDDLFIMSGFNLDVQSPFPMPEKDILGRKPKRVPYNTHEVVYKHYGRNVELMIEKAFKIEDEEDLYVEIVKIGKLMKAFYITWNKDNVMDSLILDHIEKIARKKLPITLVERIKAENSLEITIPKDKKTNNVSGNKKVQPTKQEVKKPEPKKPEPKKSEPKKQNNIKNTKNNNNFKKKKK